MVYLAVKAKEGTENTNWMGVYAFGKEKDAWSFLDEMQHCRPDAPEYKDPCSYRLFSKEQEEEAMTWAGVTQITGQRYTKKQDVAAITSAMNPREKRELGFNPRRAAHDLRVQANRNAERITGQPWNRQRERRTNPPQTSGERMNQILFFYLRKDIKIVNMKFFDNESTTVVAKDVWYLKSNKLTYNGKTYEGNSFQNLYEAAAKDIPEDELQKLILESAVKLPKHNLDVINDMIFFEQFGILKGCRTGQGLEYRMVGTEDTPIQYSILKNLSGLMTIAPIQLSFEITDKKILKMIIDREEFGI